MFFQGFSVLHNVLKLRQVGFFYVSQTKKKRNKVRVFSFHCKCEMKKIGATLTLVRRDLMQR